MVSLIYLSAGIVIATSAHGAEWRFLGSDPLVPGAEIFLLADGIQDFGDGNFRAVTLMVHPVTVRGVDLPGPNGELVYALYPHRSVASFDLYDCRRRMIANLQTIYFSGTRPREDEKVLETNEVEPMLLPVTDFEMAAYNAVCGGR